MTFLKLYGPGVLTIVLIILALGLEFKDSVIFKIKPPFLEIEYPITNKIAGRIILILISLGCLYSYLHLDFTQFFPDRFEMEVFYDKEGLRDSLRKFSNDELEEIGYNVENDQFAKIYYEDLDKKIKEILNFNGFFSLHDGEVHSQGETFFKVIKVPGIQKYHISKSKGKLIHILERPQHPAIQCISFFEKLPSSHDYLRPSFSDIFLKGEIILKPKFKQILAENYTSEGVKFDHKLVSITKIYLFPVPQFSNTIYLFQLEGKGLIPIGYAVYK